MRKGIGLAVAASVLGALIFGVGCGGPEASRPVERAYDAAAEKAALSALEAALPRGGGYRRENDDPGQPVTRLQLRGQLVNDELLRHAADLTRLREVQIQFSEITGSGLRHFEGFPDLAVLRLNDNGALTDEGLRGLRNLLSVRELSLPGPNRIGDAGLRHLERLERLEVLDVSHSRVTDVGLMTLVRLPQLRHVTLRGTQVSSNGVAKFFEARAPLNAGRITVKHGNR